MNWSKRCSEPALRSWRLMRRGRLKGEPKVARLGPQHIDVQFLCPPFQRPASRGHNEAGRKRCPYLALAGVP